MSTISDKFRGRLWVIAAALLWSSSGLFAKAPIFDAWPVETRGSLARDARPPEESPAITITDEAIPTGEV
jgi:hypothetical protein